MARRPFTLGGYVGGQLVPYPSGWLPSPNPPDGRMLANGCAQFWYRSMCPAASLWLPTVAPPCLITYCGTGNHPPYTASTPSADTRISVGLQRGRSASARRVLRNCLWCGILYRVRDPGDSRRAPLKRVRNREQGYCSPNG